MTSFILAIVYLIGLRLLGGSAGGLDRKVAARMQGRKGPSVCCSLFTIFISCSASSPLW